MDWPWIEAEFRRRGLDDHTLAAYRTLRAASPRQALASVLGEIDEGEAFSWLLDPLPKGRFHDGLECAPRIAQSGAILGETLHRLVHADSTTLETSRRVVRLWNLIQAYFDDIVDEYDGLDQQLAARVSAHEIEQCLDGSSTPAFTCRSDDHILVRFTAALARRFFCEIVALPGRATRPETYRELCASLLEAYREGLATAPARLGASIVPVAAGVRLRARSIAPLKATVLAVSLTHASAIRLEEDLVTDIADFFRLVDDAADLELDVDNRTWNSAAIEYVMSEPGQVPERVCAIELLADPVTFAAASRHAFANLFSTWDRLFAVLVRRGRGDVARMFLHMAYGHAFSVRTHS